jgi:hypothetical protein
MKRLLQTIGIDRMFAALPAAAVVLLTTGLLGLLALDLLLPDPLFLVEEALLGLLLFGGISDLFRRRRLRAPDVPSGRITEVRPAPASVRSLAPRTSALVARFRHLEGVGELVVDGSALAGLGASVQERLDRLRGDDAWLSRKEHDPWQLDRSIRRREEDRARAREDGRSDEVTQLDGRIDELRGSRLEVDARLRAREGLLDELDTLSAQVDELAQQLELDVVDADTLAVSGTVDPAIERLLATAREVAAAAAEVDAAVEQARTAGRLRSVTPER